ncbi:hypothetical protein MTO96_016015 [Rhipicephalus appendiculatus]
MEYALSCFGTHAVVPEDKYRQSCRSCAPCCLCGETLALATSGNLSRGIGYQRGALEPWRPACRRVACADMPGDINVAGMSTNLFALGLLLRQRRKLSKASHTPSAPVAIPDGPGPIKPARRHVRGG